MRLDKLIETTNRASRKEIKKLLATKKVKIDGKVEGNGSRNVDSLIHEITICGQLVKTDHEYYLLNKPAGVVTARKDPEHLTATQLIKSPKQGQLTPVGRLDRDTQGLLLLTDNGQLVYELLLPEKKVAKVYEVWVNEPLSRADVKQFASGITFLGGVTCLPAKLEISQTEENCYFGRVTIQEGKFHQVKKMFLACGKKVIALKRVQMGPLVLPEDLAPGEYRPLDVTQLEKLKPFFR